MGARYLNPSELAYVRWLASEITKWRRPRRATRVRTFVLQDPPSIPAPRRPIDVTLLRRVLTGLHRLPGAV